MIEPFLQTNNPLCIKCNAEMRFSCREVESSGFVNDVFECRKCRSTQSYVTSERADRVGVERRVTQDRRSGPDTRSEAERQMVGEQRSQIVRRAGQNRAARQQPSPDQLSLFAKRVKRAMRDEKSRHFFCVASGENDFRGHADVLRVLEWIEELAKD
jgi:hypothetical protein